MGAAVGGREAAVQHGYRTTCSTVNTSKTKLLDKIQMTNSQEIKTGSITQHHDKTHFKR